MRFMPLSQPALNIAQNASALATMDDAAVRELAKVLLGQVADHAKRVAEDAKRIAIDTQELQLRQSKIDALTHEIRLLRRMRFGAKTEAMDATQVKLFEEANAEDLSAAEQRLKALVPEVGTPPASKDKPNRKALPAHLPRTDIHHEPVDTTCKCGEPMKRIGQDVSERLDYVPGVFSVERHIRGVWACTCCECMRQEAMPAQIIDAGIPTANLLAHVLIAKYDDHLPLYRQCEIYTRAGVDPHCQPWPTGWALQVWPWLPLHRRSRHSCCKAQCCTPMSRPSRCWTTRARSTGGISGRTPRANMNRARRWCTKSKTAELVSMPGNSCATNPTNRTRIWGKARQIKVRRDSGAGTWSWTAIRATRRCLSQSVMLQ